MGGSQNRDGPRNHPWPWYRHDTQFQRACERRDGSLNLHVLLGKLRQGLLAAAPRATVGRAKPLR